MGTRSLLHIKDEGKTLVTLYRQYDGYPTGMGKDIKDALAKGKARLTNGYSGSDKNPEVFNGMGCLAAYLVVELKGRMIWARAIRSVMSTFTIPMLQTAARNTLTRWTLPSLRARDSIESRVRSC